MSTLTIANAKKIYRQILFWVLFEEHSTSGDGEKGEKHDYKTISAMVKDGAERIVKFVEKQQSEQDDEDEREEGEIEFEKKFETLEFIWKELFPCASHFHADDSDELFELFEKLVKKYSE